MFRSMMLAAVLAFSFNALATEAAKEAAPAGEAKPAAYASKKTKEECEKEGHKDKKALKKCMAGH